MTILVCRSAKAAIQLHLKMCNAQVAQLKTANGNTWIKTLPLLHASEIKLCMNSMHSVTAGSDFATAASVARDRWEGRAALKPMPRLTSNFDLPLVPSSSAARQPPPPDTSLSPGGSAKPLLLHPITWGRPLTSHFPNLFFCSRGVGSRGLFGCETTALSFLSLLVFTWSIKMPADFPPSRCDEWPSAVPPTAGQLMPHNYSVDA